MRENSSSGKLFVKQTESPRLIHIFDNICTQNNEECQVKRNKINSAL